ncbi:receptor-like protein 47 [Brassica rapa]|uniref:receptor-like protein 47 n=1 Tax=Brassica campestris TaxID=3711 RepID=UPI00142E3A55|nr:receptor-like protein 47 [Brassica rapa]
MIMWSLCFLFSLSDLILVFASSAKHLCPPDQRDALWEFKSEFSVQELDSSWWESDLKTERWRSNTDCCAWDGISCDSKTGTVVELDLWGSSLNGPLRSNSSLFRLQHLQSLNLSSNNLPGILPDSIGNLKYLRVLKLCYCNFFGKILSSLGNLSYLTDLDLSVNQFSGELPDSMGNLNRLSELQLRYNNLGGNFPAVLLNLSELTQISLSYNKFKGMLPSNMSSLTNLEYLDINGNLFYGPLPSPLFMIPSLIQLNLEGNSFSGPIEIKNISSPSNLEVLSLGENNFDAPIQGSLSKLAGLRTLELNYMNTRIMVDLSYLSHLKSLSYLDLSGNDLKFSSTLRLPYLGFLFLSSCNIVEFPKFLQSQTRLLLLDISVNQIEGKVPEWFWRLEIPHVNISQNYVSGFDGSADVIQRTGGVVTLDISSNAFREPFPLLPNSTNYLFGSDNLFSGEIPRTICDLVYLERLVLSNNNFSGSIPLCLSTYLSVLHLRNNSISSVFPEDFISNMLISLDLGYNRLSGGLPKSLINCTRLQFLNVEENRISDTFPFWLRVLPNLEILVLRSNEFHGPISSFSLPKLRIFDISRNRFTGVLQSDFFAGWGAMSLPVVYFEGDSQYRFSGVGKPYYQASVALTNKGSNMKLVGSGFTIYKTIDISGNRFEGGIPESIGLLKELIVLNMSNNAFTGRIPPSLSNITSLQSLDLSQNQLSGKIPPEIAKLTFLAWMNFSYNRLEGPIPQGTQIQSQNISSFAENPELCGVPLQKTCGGGEGAINQEQEDEDEDEEKDQVLSWTAAAIAYLPGVFCGFTLGHILTSYRHGWFMMISTML